MMRENSASDYVQSAFFSRWHSIENQSGMLPIHHNNQVLLLSGDVAPTTTEQQKNYAALPSSLAN